MDDSEITNATQKQQKMNTGPNSQARQMTTVLNEENFDNKNLYEMQKVGEVYVKIPLQFECDKKHCNIRFRTAEEQNNHLLIHETNQDNGNGNKGDTHDERAKMLAAKFEANIFNKM